MKQVVFILGTGHCGSTLIDLILGSNKKIRSLGEINSLMNNELKNNGFWNSDLIKKVEKHFRFKKNKIISFDFYRFPRSKIFENRKDLYQTIFQNTPEEILIDSSKQLAWVKRGVSHVGEDIEPKIIYLFRNPLAVINSYKRKSNSSLVEITKDVKKRLEKNNTFYKNISVKKTFLSYEDFCNNPEEKIKELCVFLDINFESDMLEYWKFDHNHISGNSGTRSLLDKYRQKGLKLDNSRQDQNYYKEHKLEIKRDDRWKYELKSEDIKIIKNLLKES